MRTTETRQRGVTIEVIDLSELYAKALEMRQETKPEVVRCDSSHRWAKATAPDGTRYVICSEGVGWVVSDTENVDIDLYDKTEGGFNIVPNLTANLSTTEIDEFPVTETVDLADFIRTFGDRLEQNFRTWHANLTA